MCNYISIYNARDVNNICLFWIWMSLRLGWHKRSCFYLTVSVTLIIHIHWLAGEWSLIFFGEIMHCWMRVRVALIVVEMFPIKKWTLGQLQLAAPTSICTFTAQPTFLWKWTFLCLCHGWFTVKYSLLGKRIWGCGESRLSVQVCMLHTMRVFDCNPTHDQCDGKVVPVGQKLSSAYLKH